jgi:hypothetical protein
VTRVNMNTIEPPQNHAQEAVPPQLGEAAAAAAVVSEPKVPQPRKTRKNRKRLAIGSGIAVLLIHRAPAPLPSLLYSGPLT